MAEQPKAENPATQVKVPPTDNTPVPTMEDVMKAMYACMKAKDKLITYLCQHATLPIAAMKYLQDITAEENQCCEHYNKLVIARQNGGKQ